VVFIRYAKPANLHLAVAAVLIGLLFLSSGPIWSFLEKAGEAREGAALVQRDSLVALVSAF